MVLTCAKIIIAFCNFLKEINSHTCGIYLFERMVWFMVFSITFSNILVISWRSVLMVKETGVPVENHRPVASYWQTLLHNVVFEYTSPAMNCIWLYNFLTFWVFLMKVTIKTCHEHWIKYSKTCFNWTLNKMQSFINRTLIIVPRNLFC